MPQPRKSSHPSPEPRTDSPFIAAREQIKKAHSLDLLFSRFASGTARIIGHPLVFLCSLLIVLVWAACGPLFRYSDTWQLVINTGTTTMPPSAESRKLGAVCCFSGGAFFRLDVLTRVAPTAKTVFYVCTNLLTLIPVIQDKNPPQNS